jgi:hypothetical protein
MMRSAREDHMQTLGQNDSVGPTLSSLRNVTTLAVRGVNGRDCASRFLKDAGQEMKQVVIRLRRRNRH